MGQILLAIILIFLVWDAVWWLLGVKPRFPWQLKDRLDAGASDLVLLDVRTPWNITGSTCLGPKTCPMC